MLKNQKIKVYLAEAKQAIENSDRTICVTCTRKDTNNSLEEDKKIRDENRSNGNIYPIADDKRINRKNGDESVMDAYKKEKINAENYASNLCECGCVNVYIIVRSLDNAGKVWINDNIVGPVEAPGGNSSGIIVNTINCALLKNKKTK